MKYRCTKCNYILLCIKFAKVKKKNCINGMKVNILLYILIILGWIIYFLYSIIYFRAVSSVIIDDDIFNDDNLILNRDSLKIQNLTSFNASASKSIWDHHENAPAMTMLHLRMNAMQRSKVVKLMKSSEMSVKLDNVKLSQYDFADVLNMFLPEYNCASLERIGELLNGQGWWLCGTRTFLNDQNHKCIIYSFNKNNSKMSFEQTLARETSCEIHVFDPFISKDDVILQNNNDRIKYHYQWLGVVDDQNYMLDELDVQINSFPENTLSQVNDNINT